MVPLSLNFPFHSINHSLHSSYTQTNSRISVSPQYSCVMEAMMIKPYKTTHFQSLEINRSITMHNLKRHPFIFSVITDKSNTNKSSASSTHDGSSEQVIYNDNWFDRLAINHLSNSVQASTGLRSKNNGYDGLAEAATMASRQFSPTEQREIIKQALATAFPKPIMSLIKTLLPQSKFAREYFAVFTTIFFSWLVGPCEVRESETDGRKEKNVVHITKCRFLEATNCVGMCTNLCKIPSQTFIKESLGMPINMVPNFDDMSCEMIFGQEPPPQSLDPAFAQPCYKQCKAVYRHQKICTN